MDGLDSKPYSTRLKELNLPSLKYRRKRADVIQAYRIFQDIDKLQSSHFFSIRKEGRTRTNGCKIFKQHCQTKVRRSTFSQRVTDPWNSLPAEVISAPSLNRFKSALAKHWQHDPDRFMSNMSPPKTQSGALRAAAREDHQFI